MVIVDYCLGWAQRESESAFIFVLIVLLKHIKRCGGYRGTTIHQIGLLCNFVASIYSAVCSSPYCYYEVLLGPRLLSKHIKPEPYTGIFYAVLTQQELFFFFGFVVG